MFLEFDEQQKSSEVSSAYVLGHTVYVEYENRKLRPLGYASTFFKLRSKQCSPHDGYLNELSLPYSQIC